MRTWKTKKEFKELFIKKAEVLFEKDPRGKSMHGFTKNYIRVELPAVEAREEYDNHLMTVRLGEWKHDKTALKVTLKNG